MVETALHEVCYNDDNVIGNNNNENNNTGGTSIAIVSKIIQVGGYRLLMKKEKKYQQTALHFACAHNAPLEVITMMIDRGGKKLIRQTNRSGENALHFACGGQNPAIVSKLIQIGGKKLLQSTNHYGTSMIGTVLDASSRNYSLNDDVLQERNEHKVDIILCKLLQSNFEHSEHGRREYDVCGLFSKGNEEQGNRGGFYTYQDDTFKFSEYSTMMMRLCK